MVYTNIKPIIQMKTLLVNKIRTFHRIFLFIVSLLTNIAQSLYNWYRPLERIDHETS